MTWEWSLLRGHGSSAGRIGGMLSSAGSDRSNRLPALIGGLQEGIRTLKERCVHRYRPESQTHAMRVIADWIRFATSSAHTKR